MKNCVVNIHSDRCISITQIAIISVREQEIGTIEIIEKFTSEDGSGKLRKDFVFYYQIRENGIDSLRRPKFEVGILGFSKQNIFQSMVDIKSTIHSEIPTSFEHFAFGSAIKIVLRKKTGIRME